jgi:methionine-S-sulfoxide reductase
VVATRVGYSGGTTGSPTYSAIGDHTETVQVDYDPTVVSYEDLLAVFWDSHNPLAQPYSRQYRAAVFVHDDEQRAAAEASFAREAIGRGARILTVIEPLTSFTRAEDYHQKYWLRRVDLIFDELTACYETDRDLVDSLAAARLNGYLGGHGDAEQLQREIARFGLSVEAQELLVELTGMTNVSCGG